MMDNIVIDLENNLSVIVVVPMVDLMFYLQGFFSQQTPAYHASLYYGNSSHGERILAINDSKFTIGTLQTLSQGCDLSKFDKLVFIGCGDGQICKNLKASYEARCSINKPRRIDSIL
jgi:hypothetical protein